jgi:hypothetical protein
MLTVLRTARIYHDAIITREHTLSEQYIIYAVRTMCSGTRETRSMRRHERLDAEILHVCARFHALDAELDRFVALDDPPEWQFVALHEQWSDLLAQALTPPAHTIEGKQAKEAVLKTAMAVILGTLPAQPESLCSRWPENLDRICIG